MFRELFNLSSEIVFLIEVTSEGYPGRFIEVNDAACRGLGYTREEFLLMSLNDIKAPETTDQAEILEQFRLNGMATFDAVAVRKNGTKLHFENNTKLLKIKNKECYLSAGNHFTKDD